MVMVNTNNKLTSQALKLAKIVARRKTQEEEGDQGGTSLARVLGLADLIMLGVGSTLGLGAYVLAGAVAKTSAGPAVTVSFLIAAVASAFAGLCYAEFAARVPKAGSAYVYSYVTVGELAAFIIGWNLILEYIIGSASVARGLSNYVDFLMGKRMSESLTEIMPINVSWLSPYPDFLSFSLLVLVSCLIAYGVKESSLLNNIFTAMNLLVVASVVLIGAFYIDISNWMIKKEDIPVTDPSGNKVVGGEGGFMPFGFSGVMAGAAKCFYGFVGFDCVATTGEEAKNPRRDIPLSIVISLLIIFLAYFGTSSVLTLMCPYYLQDADAPLPYVFDRVNMPVIKYAVSVGAVAALTTNTIGTLFPIPRVVYSMAQDKLLFRRLGHVNSYTRTPLLAIMLGGLCSGVMACMFNLDELIDMMSIGTLLAYTIVALSVLMIRYRVPVPAVYHDELENSVGLGDTLNSSRLKQPSKKSEGIAVFTLSIYMLVTIALCVTLINVETPLYTGEPWAISLVSVLAAVMVLAVLVLCRQPTANEKLNFKVPLVPVLPCASIFINFYLMAMLDLHTWIRFTIWLLIGMLIYVFYSIPNSLEGQKIKKAEKTAARERFADKNGNNMSI